MTTSQVTLWEASKPPAKRKGVGKSGDKLQRHFTPLALARIIIAMLVARLPRAPDVFVEPSCGDGAFLIAAVEAWPNVRTIGVDIDKGARGLQLCDTAILGDWPTAAKGLIAARDPDELYVIEGNPPFKAKTGAETKAVIAHVKAAIALGDHTALILPWPFLGGAEKWDSIMVGDAAPLEAGTITPRAWPVVRETAAFYWRERGIEDRAGTNVFRLPRWKKRRGKK